MDDGARGWLLKTAQKNYWRVASFYDLDDLIQEGYLVYYKVVRKYPDVTAPRHLMALFQRAFINRLHDLANARTRAVPEIHAEDLGMSTDEGVGSILDLMPADAEMTGALVNLINAPAYVRDALALFTTPEGLRRLRSKSRHPARTGRRTNRRETLNDRIRRLLGIDEEIDIVGALRSALGAKERCVVVPVVVHSVQREIVVERVVCGERKTRVLCLAARNVVSAGG